MATDVVSNRIADSRVPHAPMVHRVHIGTLHLPEQKQSDTLSCWEACSLTAGDVPGLASEISEVAYDVIQG